MVLVMCFEVIENLSLINGYTVLVNQFTFFKSVVAVHNVKHCSF